MPKLTFEGLVPGGGTAYLDDIRPREQGLHWRNLLVADAAAPEETGALVSAVVGAGSGSAAAVKPNGAYASFKRDHAPFDLKEAVFATDYGLEPFLMRVIAVRDGERVGIERVRFDTPFEARKIAFGAEFEGIDKVLLRGKNHPPGSDANPLPAIAIDDLVIETPAIARAGDAPWSS